MYNHKLIFSLIIAAVCLGNAGSTLYLPAMPAIAKAYQVDESSVKLTLSLFLMGYSFSSLIYGPLSDAFGRKMSLTLGISIFFIGCVFSVFSENIYYFIISRVIQGLGMGSSAAVGYSVVRDIFHGVKLTKQLSYVSIFAGLIPLIAPLIGGYILSVFPWSGCFYFLGLFALLLLVLKVFFFKETLPSEHKQSFNIGNILRNYTHLLTNSGYLLFSSACAIAFSGIFTTGSVLPFLIVKQLGVSPEMYGWIAGIPSIGYVFGAYISSRLASRFSLRKLSLFGSTMGILGLVFGLLISSFGFNLYTLIIPLFVFLFGIGILVPVTTSGCMLPFPHLAGSASALLMAYMFMAAAIISALVALFNIQNGIQLFALLLVIPVAVFLIARKIAAR